MMPVAPIRLQRVGRRDRLGGEEIPLVPPQGMWGPRRAAVMTALGAIAAGLGMWLALRLIWLMFSFWGAERTIFPEVAGGSIIVVGVAFAVLTYKPERNRPSLNVAGDVLAVKLTEYARPLLVPREHVRVVAIDDTPVKLFTKNHRFPIAGTLPEAVFADALERRRYNPWDPGESPVPRDPAPVSGVSGETDAGDDANEDAPGWARARLPEPQTSSVRGYLYSGDGSALPIFCYNPNDIPNLAIVFKGPVRLPRRALDLFGVVKNGDGMRRSRASVVAGMLLRVKDAEQARRAFAPWNAIRAVTADDVLDAGLRPPKPLRGWRAVAFAAFMLTPVLLKIIGRLLR